MNNGIAELKKEFSQHKQKARNFNPAAIPIINELEIVAIERAKGKLTPSKANQKIKSCCMKIGINPIGVDQSAMETQFDFNQKKPGKQKNLNIKIPKLINNKPNNSRARRRGLTLPSFFPAAPQKKKQQFPALGLKSKKQSKNKNVFEIKPIDFGMKPKRKNSKSEKGFKLKPIKLGKWF